MSTSETSVAPRLSPGFVDMHVHGGGGASFQSGAADDVTTAAAFHRRHGTTSLVASLVTAPVADLVTSVRRLAELATDGVVAGIHLEGPFPAGDFCGAHDPELLRDPDPESLDLLLGAGAGHIAMITLAPERAGGLDAVRRVVDAGSVAAIGHTAADYDTVGRAVEAGATVATHLFNGMPSLHHRTPGPVAALLEDERVVVELINDGIHLHPAMLRLPFAAAPGRTALVTDAISATGPGDGEVLLGELRVTVRDGQARLVDGGSLAGSVLTLDRAVRNAVAAGVPVLAALRAASTVPADALGIGDRAGRIRVGAPADPVVLDERLEVVDVLSASG
ncbi:N-acetylglucosamine-6-phosphate deacetylase [Nocardioides sp. B-3]|uniref:N-acetylglucosamine-6-phosphate deacetylase n=1 Tax=Nocardioides sp. B-3 TaxID=2895565 RepID=UPI002152D18D|nr:N-acetylglucosamine-6-phosphate deacetylase [Nocardioides sp. B-3]UUZ60727.1 N-acetylglucosamine-6-phosphate deacetylase [Nocardioides sp. B-3]